MPIEITIPRLGWSMEEGVFAGWLKEPGDHVSAGDPLFAVESDKVTMEVESLDSGVLHLQPGAPEAGAAVRIGQPIGLLLGPGESAPQPTAVAAITPRARRIAAELGIDPTALPGTGRGGRIREADVRTAVPAARPAPSRETIAARMLESHRTTAPVTLTTRADATALVALRNRWKDATDPAPSFNDILAKLVAEALRAHPALGGRWENGRIVNQGESNIGIAVDTPHGLLVPVLREVAKTPLPELARRSRGLISAALSRRLRAEDLTGGTFTITNLGHFGIDAFTPILNAPEIAILGVGAIRMDAVVLENGGLAARERITLSLTFDHRAVDGAPAARFLHALVQLIESPPAAAI